MWSCFMGKTILLCVCHYNDTSRVMEFAREVLRLPCPEGWQVEIAIADNSCNWPEQEELPPQATLVRTGENLGYIGGCAAAFEAWVAAKDALPEWSGVFNTDLTLGADFFVALGGLSIDDGVGALAPYISTTEENRNHNPFMRDRMSRHRAYFYTFMTARPSIYRMFVLSQPIRATLRRAIKRGADAPHDAALSGEFVYAPHGAAVLLHRRFFERGGTLRFRGFMYSEEIHLAEQIRRCGLKVQMAPSLRVEHEGNFTTGLAGSDRIRQWQAQSSRVVWEDYFAST